jgi:hypothetical protein
VSGGVSPAHRAALAEPRPLEARERALLDLLLAGPLGREALRHQAATAQVSEACSCGCPSVWLEVDRAVPVAVFRADESPSGRADWVPLTARAGDVDVTLHVVGGRLAELEVWAGTEGARPHVDPASLVHD